MKNNEIHHAIDNFLGRFDSFEAIDPPPNTSATYHIYNKLEEAYRNELTDEDIRTMYYHFYSYETCLQHLKSRDLNTAEMLFEKTQALERNFDVRVKAGMELIFWAMSAYRQHVHGHLDAALAELDIAIQNCEEQARLFPVISSSIQEQWLNKLRVQFRKKDPEAARKEAEELLYFTFTGKYKPGKEYITTAMHNQSQDDQRTMFWHIFRNIVMELQRPNAFDSEIQDEFMLQLCNNLCEQVTTPTINMDDFNIVPLLHAYYSGQSATFITMLDINFETFRRATKNVQQLVIKHFMSLVPVYGYDITTHPNYAVFSGTLEKKIGLKASAITSAE